MTKLLLRHDLNTDNLA